MAQSNNQPAEITFSINEVAKLIGVVPATLRNWEKEKLFIARRKENNYRYYTFDDIELLKKIHRYSVEDSMPLKSIRHLVSSEQLATFREAMTMPGRSAAFSKKGWSHRWKEARENLGFTLEKVSRETGISPSYLSKIENDQANVSYEVLERLALFYGESPLYFYHRSNEEEHVVRKDQGEIIDIGFEGVTMTSLIASRHHVLYPMVFEIEPGSGPTQSHRHHGEEFIHILKGTLEVLLNGNETYQLKAGDSMCFHSSDEHIWRNPTEIHTRLIWVHSPLQSPE